MKILDIETVPQDGIMKTWYRDWAKKKFPEMTEEELEHQAGLYPEFGMICAIGISESCGKPTSCTARNFSEERSMLIELREILGETEELVGHNLKGFDLPFLAKRYLYHDLAVPKTLRVAGKKPWDIPHVDTMELMRFGGGMSMSLRSACFLLGLGDPKFSFDGSEVWDLFKKGEMGLIASYVEGDCSYTDKLYKKLMNLAI